ncbi:hypothetical protein BCS96_15660 [Vibrio breoganii]|uniref:DUF6314 family protein n=1 Tax=Vibrio breoganii TaxID=553239 RepID=UPI000C83D1A9|nr:DUF6314 family protein [Vibrio breoganii]PMG39171.1 hypothetical protein BCU93_12400 [Vibrio breoganii]PML91157.1 hypothetical protein BCT68_03375 [Vibrio breoganii]PMM18575.1 hypothetical protein BCT59_11950 [Vibrio breoganii]PMM47626.1 hypothetical protein BCT52_00040 [Vibrio breoganii]PMM89166.1 hypothetical protein BCT45_00010 [Vibrio breoganii]
MFDLWQQLQLINHYQYQSKPGANSVMGWAGEGSGSVNIEMEETDTLYFKEQGRFTLEQNGHTVDTQNEFIWQRLDALKIKLLHSRFGRENAVELFVLSYNAVTKQWISDSAHVCGDDLYSGMAKWNNDSIEFNWSISGPRKQENLHYRYTR